MSRHIFSQRVSVLKLCVVALGTLSASAHEPAKESHWAFEGIRSTETPAIAAGAWNASRIDAFIFEKLRARGIEPNPRASKTELLKRTHYAITGLPPSLDEIEAFLADDEPAALEKVVDRLLASPAFGERWGRRWLDLVRFAETNSFENDELKPNAWRYRDWVIAAFNDDKPYDAFLQQQIAGYEMLPVTAEGLIATGYLRLGAWDFDPTDRLAAQYDDIDGIVATTSQVFLGLTLDCARCHDHKIDPLTQRDYYSFLAFFRNLLPHVKEEEPGLVLENYQRDLPGLEAPVHPFHADRQSIHAESRDLEDRVLAQLSHEDRIEASKSTLVRRELVEANQSLGLDEYQIKRYDELKDKLAELNAKEKPPARGLCVRERSRSPRDTWILARGNAHAPGEKVEPGFPRILNPPKPSFPKLPPEIPSSGVRIALASWIASDQNPLAARVAVNRLWQGVIGRGIVRSPNDFGLRGARPTHPELLDVLATDFVVSGWQTKRALREIALSNTFAQSSRPNAKSRARDLENDLFWRIEMRRLSAEEIRDSVLDTAGILRRRMGGHGVYPPIPREVLATQSRPGIGWGLASFTSSARRSVYVHQKRTLMLPILAIFDAPVPDSSCAVRFTSTQPTQALSMLNGGFANVMAKLFARRVSKNAESAKARVELALRLVLRRSPSVAEVERGLRFLADSQSKFQLDADAALRSFCLLAMNLNEFLYVD